MPSDAAPRIALIAAVAENGVIGRAGGIPWRLPSDLKHFKALTIGHTLVMGRATFLSIGRPLPGRRTLVVTRTPIEGVETVASLKEALAAADRPVFLAGGARIYGDGMAHADTIFLTRVHARPDGDTHFPPIDPAVFAVVETETGVPAGADEHPFDYVVLKRRVS